MKRILLFILFVSSFNAIAFIPNISVSIPPIAFLVEQITQGSNAQVYTLLTPGQDPHTFSPTPREIASISKSRLYISVGMPFEKQLVSKLQTMQRDLQVLKLTDAIKVRHYKKEEQDEESKLEGGDDVHFWLSPLVVQEVIQAITQRLSQMDALHANLYRENAQRLSQKFNQMHGHLQKILSPFKGMAIYVYHPAFGYFTDAYNLIQRPMELEGKTPSAKQMQNLIMRAKKEHPKVIFIQPQFSPKQAEVLAKGLKARVVRMDDLQKNILDNLDYMGQEISKALELK